MQTTPVNSADPGFYPPRKRRWPWVLLTLLVLLVLAVGGCVALAGNAIDDAAERHEADQASAAQEVTTNGCEVRTGVAVWATGTVTNGTSQRSDYTIEVVSVGADGVQRATGITFAPNVDPGQTAQWEAPMALDPADAGDCKVVDVTRMAST